LSRALFVAIIIVFVDRTQSILVRIKRKLGKMDEVTTAEDFHAFPTSDEDDNPLLAALRRLTGIGESEEIVAATAEHAAIWQWH
jgi:hypothetical protein